MIHLLLVQETTGFSIREDVDSEAGQTPLTANEVNSLLDQIVASNRKNKEEPGVTEDVIRQTRERIE